MFRKMHKRSAKIISISLAEKGRRMIMDTTMNAGDYRLQPKYAQKRTWISRYWTSDSILHKHQPLLPGDIVQDVKVKNSILDLL